MQLIQIKFGMLLENRTRHRKNIFGTNRVNTTQYMQCKNGTKKNGQN